MCLGQTMREVWGQAGSYEVLLDVTVTHLVPGLQLERQPNYNGSRGRSWSLSWRCCFWSPLQGQRGLKGRAFCASTAQQTPGHTDKALF